MAKTLALFFVLGFLASCASYHHERSTASIEQHEREQHDYRFNRFMR
jgi:hypothetical protein